MFGGGILDEEAPPTAGARARPCIVSRNAHPIPNVRVRAGWSGRKGLPVLARRHHAPTAFGAIALSLAAATGLALSSSAAPAQNLLESLFGGLRATPAPAPPADPPGAGNTKPGSAVETDPRVAERSAGPSVAYCVRLCDGRYFPIQSHAGAMPADMCKLFCPASKTKVFSGSQIDRAEANDGIRYVDSANAFVYRKRFVANCTCNGRDAFGLAAIDVKTDPTLRAGDMIATGNGLRSHQGYQGSRRVGAAVDAPALNTASTTGALQRAKLDR